MGWTPETMANWVGKYLGPTLKSSAHDNTLILVFDDNREVLPEFVEPTFKDRNVAKYVAGTAIHWYNDSIASPDILNELHDEFPDKFILMTEASIGT